MTIEQCKEQAAPLVQAIAAALKSAAEANAQLVDLIETFQNEVQGTQPGFVAELLKLRVDFVGNLADPASRAGLYHVEAFNQGYLEVQP